MAAADYEAFHVFSRLSKSFSRPSRWQLFLAFLAPRECRLIDEWRCSLNEFEVFPDEFGGRCEVPLGKGWRRLRFQMARLDLREPGDPDEREGDK